MAKAKEEDDAGDDEETGQRGERV
ncbi:hypothetical protein TSOC_015277 [Tetrabaena socialis]|uniref:Uncharacterized protein n=1 Tax=Tetrabaena socialis TaxID=47790 RepID=A0A2J7Z119_9CHLO|nr:hypothetical protein TSOC_015277 [Tetrabaena socialis]|eukprot:PNG93967.1 hypothetical protein TSOC_015277 [Tetrabaena socialis]